MRPFLTALLLGLVGAGTAQAQGLLVPTQNDVPPLALVGHEVRVRIEDQAAVTDVVQTFRNATSRALEATYIFPIPQGASVKKFTMWVDGQETPGELVEADKARAIYTDIVRRTQDPGLLEYLGGNLLKVRVFPVPANGEQKLKVSYTSLATSDNGLIEYIYPLRADGKAARSLEKFTLEATLKAQTPIQSVYSPTHAVKVSRPSDREAVVRFEGKRETFDKDFQLYYTAAATDVGLTALVHRASYTADGHFMLLISPRAELARTQQAPRDMIFVLDTSGSMQGKRIVQAKAALKYCLKNLDAKDRFGLIHFATGVTKFQDKLAKATAGQIEQAKAWVEGLEAVGSTNIDEALATALAMRSTDAGRTCTIVFFTDGQPTIGETNPQRIIANVGAKNTANTRIFTFGVGDDVNAVLLDQLAEKTRSVSTYVRESEDIEAKVSSLYGKISHPVLTNLKLKVGDGVTISEVYPPQLPDLFHGSQLVVLGRYKPALPLRHVQFVFDVFQQVALGIDPARWTGSYIPDLSRAMTAVTLAGMVGTERKNFEYKVHFAQHTKNDKAFVEDLWARRKVGYLLDQIRTDGENKELVGEVVSLAKKYGIATPYTSYLVAPDASYARFNTPGVMPNMQWQVPNTMLSIPAAPGSPLPQMFPNDLPSNGAPAKGSMSIQPAPTVDWLQYYKNHSYQTNIQPSVGANRVQFAPVNISPQMSWATSNTTVRAGNDLHGNGLPWNNQYLSTGNGIVAPTVQSGKQGVDLAQQLSAMRNLDRVGQATVRQAAGRTLCDLGGVWIDDGFDGKMPVVKLKAQSEAYFRILAKYPQMREVFQLGNRIAWVTPSRSILVIDAGTGEEKMADADIDRLFAARP